MVAGARRAAGHGSKHVHAAMYNQLPGYASALTDIWHMQGMSSKHWPTERTALALVLQEVMLSGKVGKSAE